ncbi:MAG: VCBS repeat-containing protein, partial [Psychrosphaera sp.]|nr:VCBS repeat-containing protein [Psychrosphaera sp.]
MSPDMAEMMGASVTVGDYNNDGWLDIYLVRYKNDNLLYKNNGDGTFTDVSIEAGVNVTNSRGASATFADFDGDGWLDIFVSSFAATQPTVFRNTQDGKFENVTEGSGLEGANKASFSMAFGDYDNDGDNDLFVTHWKEEENSEFLQYLWQNQGDGTFVDASVASGVSAALKAADVKTFTPNFTDVNNDGWLDLTISSDFSTSRLLINNAGVFVDGTTAVIDDENGMGSAMGDFDNDGDLDWFVTSIFEGTGDQRSGNRLYQNDGQGNFTDVSENAGVRQGHWGWGSCFADFNNDTFLDIFHVNGFGNELSSDAANLQEFYEDPSKLFISNGDMTFTEQAVESGIDDDQQGRGIVCFDYDRDGDQDILISNFAQPLRLYRNDSITNANYLGVKLVGKAP